MQTSHTLRVLLANICIVTVATSAAAQTERGAFMLKLGVDTVAIERWSRTENRLEGTVVRRTPNFAISRYALTFGADGSVDTFEQQALNPDGTPAQSTPSTMKFSGDSVFRTVVQNNTPLVLRGVAPKGTVPFVAFSPTLQALQVTTARRVGAVFGLGFSTQQQAPTRIDLRLFGPDSAEVVTQGLRTGLRTNARGQLTRFDGTLTTGKYIGTPVADIDVVPLAIAWAAKEREGAGLGITGRDTTRAPVTGAAIWIDYGRPFKRGRTIWGALVPYDTTWRLGANAATQLKTDRDITIGGVTVPAGMYSLFLLPTKSGATLIVNSQIGQWGTGWDPAKDVYKIPLDWHESFPTAVEQFTIRFTSDRLELQWDKSGYVGKLSVK